MSSNTKVYEDKMKSSVEHLSRELAAVRAGRANPAVLDKVVVDYYGAPTPIQQLAAVAVSEARTLTITPWDRTLLRPISKAIMASDVGITPIDDGVTIRLNFPAPNEERRKQLAKEVSKLGEDAKVAVRNVRRDAMDKAKAMKKAGELTEDTQKTMEEDVQKLTDKYIKNIDAAVEEKQKEIMPSDPQHTITTGRCRALVKGARHFLQGSPAAGRYKWHTPKNLPRGFPSASSWTAMAAGRKTAACPAPQDTKKVRRCSRILPTTAMNLA